MTSRSTSSLHDLVDLGAHDWKNPAYKPILSPSRTASFKFCARAYRWKYVKRLAPPGSGYTAPIIQGSLYHAMAAAVDGHQDAALALREAGVRLRNHPSYEVKWSPTIDYLIREMETKWFRAYERFVADLPLFPESIISLEKVHVAEFDTFFLVTIPDKVIDRDGEVWIVERKTTSRDDPKWHDKWQANAQTTAEAMAVERVLDRPVAGVYIEPVVVTRKRAANWSHDYPQPIHSFTHYPWRPVSKPQHIRETWLDYMDGIVAEMKWRDRQKQQWAPNLMNCADCDYRRYCSGRFDIHDPQEGLVALPPDHITEMLIQERIAGGLSPTLLARLGASGHLAVPDTLVPAKPSGTSSP